MLPILFLCDRGERVLFLLITTIVTISLGILAIIQRKKRIVYLFLATLSLNEFLFFVFIFIAKKGGIPREINIFFYFNDQIRSEFRNMILTLEQLGLLMSIGRFLFPFLMLAFVIKVVYPHGVHQKKIISIIAILPLLSILGYVPFVFKRLPYNQQSIVMWSSLIWIIIYVVLAIVLLIIDIFLIKPGIKQLKYFAVNIFGCFLNSFYLLYCTQDSAQVYGFYSYEFPWTIGLSYLRLIMSKTQYRFLMLIYIALAFGGVMSLYFYMLNVFEMKREQIVLMNRNRTAIPATHIFVHGIKNHLLVEQAYIRKIERLNQKESQEEISMAIQNLLNHNLSILNHLDELYKAFRYDRIELSKNKVSEIIHQTISEFSLKYPNAPDIEIQIDRDAIIMADNKLLSEAFLNLLLNSYEELLDKKEKIIQISVKNGIFNVNISFADNGSGFSEQEKKHIFYPFTSKKNSSTNWGMGLYFTNEVIKQHYGKIYVDSAMNEGTVFKVILPKRRDDKK